jgi:hypothetical protein
MRHIVFKILGTMSFLLNYNVNFSIHIVYKKKEIMKSFITLILSLIVSTSALSFTQECEDTVVGAVEYYKSKMEGMTNKGYSYLEYNYEGMEESNTFNHTGFEIGFAWLALSKYGNAPTLIDKKYNEIGNLNGVDIITFNTYRDIVFVIEPVVKEACAGQYKVRNAGEGSFSNEKFYSNNTEVEYELESVKLNVLYISEIQMTADTDNSSKKE